MTTLYKVECDADGFTEPLTELVRARTPEEAGEIVYDFFRYEFDKPVDVQRLTIQLMREPEDGIGIVYEPAGRDTRLEVVNGRLKPIIESTPD